MRDAERLGQPEQARDRAGAAAAVPRQHRLEALAVHFEAEHPTLATTLREFIELLVQAGV